MLTMLSENSFVLHKGNMRQYTCIRTPKSGNTKCFHFIISAKPLNVRKNKDPLKNYTLFWEIGLTYMMWCFHSCVNWCFICWTIRYHVATSRHFILRNSPARKTCKVLSIREVLIDAEKNPLHARICSVLDYVF